MGLPINLEGLCNQVDQAMMLLNPGGRLELNISFGWDKRTEREFRAWCKTKGYKIASLKHRRGGATIVMAKSTK